MRDLLFPEIGSLLESHNGNISGILIPLFLKILIAPYWLQYPLAEKIDHLFSEVRKAKVFAPSAPFRTPLNLNGELACRLYGILCCTPKLYIPQASSIPVNG